MKDERLLNHFRRLRWNVQRERNRLLLGEKILQAHQRRLELFVQKIELRKVVRLPLPEAIEKSGLTKNEVRVMRAKIERLGHAG